jgi:hypothetical protein
MKDLQENGYPLFTYYNGEPLWYEDFYLAKPSDQGELYLMPELLSGSDYSGGSHTASNYRAFLKAYGDLPGIHAISGGHGTYAIAVALSTYRDNDEVRETLHALEDYPVMDDEDLSYLEQEWADETWENLACDEYLAALSKRFDVELLDVDTQEVREVFEEIASGINEYWESENASCRIDVDRVADATRYEDIQDWIDWIWSEEAA